MLADPYDKLPAITFWLMGSLAAINTSDLLILLGPMVVGGAALMLVRWHLNPLSFGDEEAQAMGVRTGVLRVVVIGACTMTACAVSIADYRPGGPIIPHLARGLVGPDYSRALAGLRRDGGRVSAASGRFGPTCRSLEQPLGVLTALIGAPFFIFLLTRLRSAWT